MFDVTQRNVAVVVLNWNGWHDTLQCLHSLQPAVSQGMARIIVVDNGSTDDSAARIRDWLGAGRREFVEIQEDEVGTIPELVSRPSEPLEPAFVYALIHARRNRGYAAGNNLGIRLALRMADTEFVFVLNNDTFVAHDAISRLVRWGDGDPSTGAIGSTLVEGGGAVRIAGGSKFNKFLTLATPVLANDRFDADIDYVAGAAVFIRVAALKEVGLFCEDYFLYFEELDFTARLRRAGFRIGWCPASIVHHKAGRSTGGRSSHTTRKSVVAEYHSNLSFLIFMHRFYPGLLWLAAPVRFFLKLVHDSIHLQPRLLIPLFKAYRDGLARLGRKTA